MSRNPHRSRALPKAVQGSLLRNDSRSDNLCYSDLVDSDRIADSDSARKREPRVGLKGGRYRSHSWAEKLAARTIPQPSGCWEVQGYALPSGYVQIAEGSWLNPPYVRIRAHVLAWELANGRKVPKGLVVMHSCDNPRCANPAHLSVGTQRQNILDSIHKGRYNCFGRQKLDAEKVREIRRLGATGTLTHKAIGKMFGVGRSAITGILSGATWGHVPDPFVQNVEPVAAAEKVVYDLPNWLAEPPARQSQAS